MTQLPSDLLHDLRLIASRNAMIDAILHRYAKAPRDEAFGWLIVELAKENESLRKYLEKRAVKDCRHPLSDDPMLHYSGGTLVLVPPANPLEAYPCLTATLPCALPQSNKSSQSFVVDTIRSCSPG